MKLSLASIENNASQWQALGVKLPSYDVAKMREATTQKPEWVHFGAGNIFRGFIGSIAQKLLDEGAIKTGIIACETFDYDIIDKIYTPFDNLTLNVIMNADGTTKREVLASIAQAHKVDLSESANFAELKKIFAAPSLKMLSFTITEKGYQLKRTDGTLLEVVDLDIKQGPTKVRHAMSIVAALLLARFEAGALPLAVVSMDNCSQNGQKLKDAVLTVAKAWQANGFVTEAFVEYLNDESKVSFPWTMIDKITPRPHPLVRDALIADGLEDMEGVVTSKSTFIAPFVNAERPEYLVVEDSFPAGRLPLDKAGVYLTDRDTVNKTERMKVTTCLNPLHTAMSMYGCLLGYTLICKEMLDEDIVKLVKRLGYVEGLPVVIDPGILSPKAFIDEVVNERLPNRFMPDDPRRIATDTSQKVGIRFGETIKSYIQSGRDLNSLEAIALALAGWMRYLLAVDDTGNAIEVSADPLREELQGKLVGIKWDDPATYSGQLREIFSNTTVFGLNIAETELFDKIEKNFVKMLYGQGSVRAILKEKLN